ncbi:hypothetical protein BEN47_08335 [Hymenobacter lapidarius]|uniref:Uncharacterized protein n=1 Tax=Hymenobacter lapidarius TaxID=1908237 RepID=A0A1G1TCZ2_9BACT|nr:hypothetical protein BEN47_08335 [Hymenobacter lapidarius]
MDENVATRVGLALGAVGGVGVVEAQRKEVVALGVEAVNFVEAFRYLAVAGAALGTQPAGGGRQRVAVQQLK